MGWECHLLKVEGKLLRGKFGMVGIHSPFTAGLQCFVLFCFILFGFWLFSPPWLFTLPTAQSQQQVHGPTGRKRWSWSGQQDVRPHKMQSFHFAMKKITILIFTFCWAFLKVVYQKNEVSTFHPKKRCAIFLSLKNIPVTSHTDFIYYYYYFCHSQHCLSDVWTNSPSFGSEWRQTSGCEWPDSSKAWTGSELLLCLGLLLINQTSHF